MSFCRTEARIAKYEAEGLNIYFPGNGEPLTVLEGESLSKISASGR